MPVNAGKTALKLSTLFFFPLLKLKQMEPGGLCGQGLHLATWVVEAPLPFKRKKKKLFKHYFTCLQMSGSRRGPPQTQACVMRPAAPCRALIESCERKKKKMATQHAGLKLPL